MNVANTLAHALRETLEQLEAAQISAKLTNHERIVSSATAALDCYAQSQRQRLLIRVCGEPARLALCDVLSGWTARRAGGAWHEIRTTDSAHHVRELMRDLRIRGTVKVVP